MSAMEYFISGRRASGHQCPGRQLVALLWYVPVSYFLLPAFLGNAFKNLITLFGMVMTPLRISSILYFQSAMWSPDGRVLLAAFDRTTSLAALHFAGRPPSLGIIL